VDTTEEWLSRQIPPPAVAALRREAYRRRMTLKEYVKDILYKQSARILLDENIDRLHGVTKARRGGETP